MTLTVQEKFEKAVAYIQGLPKDGPYKPSQETQLKYYRYYKQGTIGDVNIARPGLLDFVGKAKWDAWNEIKGTSQEEAQIEYVKLVIKDVGANNPDDSVKQLLQTLEE